MPADIIVLGAGPAGLTLALRLSRAGHRVRLIEGSDRLGGLGTWFDWHGRPVDQFYHCQMPSDEHLLELIDSVGLSDEMYWKPTRMGFIHGGKRFGFNGALDLLRFTPLRLFERLRFGVVSLLLRHLGKGRDLDQLPIGKWLIPLYGQGIWEKVLRSLFLMKFGDHADDLPALYLWSRLGRESNTARRGYLRGGLKRLIDTVEAELEGNGVIIEKQARVTAIDQNDAERRVTITLDDGRQREADWAVSTLPMTTLGNAIAGGSLARRIPVADVPYQGVVNTLFFLRRPLDNYYWSPVIDSGTEFDGLIEMTELVDTDHYNGCHAVYVMKYCGRDSELFNEPEADIAARWSEQLLALYPDLELSHDDLIDVRVFKAPFVEPIYPLGYAALKPPIAPEGSRLLLASSAQVYPNITAWNSSVGLAQEVGSTLLAKIKSEGSTAAPSSARPAERQLAEAGA